MSDSGGEEEDKSLEKAESEQITLEEIRLRYQEELDRRRSVESKVGIVLTVNAIIISVVSLYSNLTPTLYIAMAASLLSVFIGLQALRVRDYNAPGTEIDDFLQHTDVEPDTLRQNLIISHIVAITGNEETDDPEEYLKGNKTLNDSKYDSLSNCLKLTTAAIILILLNPLLLPESFLSPSLPVLILIFLSFNIREELYNLVQRVVKYVNYHINRYMRS